MTTETDKTSLYLFHIVLEAKIRALVPMCKKYHPEWTTEEIREALKNLVDIAIEKETGE